MLETEKNNQKNNKENDQKFHILCVRFSSLGDIILHSSIPSAIKNRWGDRIHITYLTSEAFAPLLEGHPDIDSVASFSRQGGIKGIRKLFELVKSIDNDRKIDLILDFHATLRSLLIRLRFLRIPRVAVDKRTIERSILTTFKIDLLSQQGDTDTRKAGYGELLLERTVRDFQGIFDYQFDRSGLSDYVCKGAKELQISSCAQTYQKGWQKKESYGVDYPDGEYICICPSASFAEKRWSAENFAALIAEICSTETLSHYGVVVLAGKEDTFCQIFDPIVEKFPNRVINLQGKTSLVESTMLVKEASFVVGNDTGVPHIAEAVGTPSIFILGPTGEQFGFYPHLRNSQAIFKRLWCRPCTTNGKGRCIRRQRYCLTTISVKDVMNEVVKLNTFLGDK